MWSLSTLWSYIKINHQASSGLSTKVAKELLNILNPCLRTILCREMATTFLNRQMSQVHEALNPLSGLSSKISARLYDFGTRCGDSPLIAYLQVLGKGHWASPIAISLLEC